ncbi:hypothetical protein [Altererythrobacter lauratis]|uniref:Uncharacterized protein n=1 Tax=Alteraurantiacibacter lauratis TaxID=2054627 RepID=A0ABV7EH97_9SPHN
MGKALHDNSLVTQGQLAPSAGLDWRKRISDHVAYALLVYTGVQIGVTMLMVKDSHGTIMPYFALVVLVAAIIPAARLFEARWSELDEDAAHDPALSAAFTRDVTGLWLCAVGLPFALAALFHGVEVLLG